MASDLRVSSEGLRGYAHLDSLRDGITALRNVPQTDETKAILKKRLGQLGSAMKVYELQPLESTSRPSSTALANLQEALACYREIGNQEGVNHCLGIIKAYELQADPGKLNEVRAQANTGDVQAQYAMVAYAEMLERGSHTIAQNMKICCTKCNKRPAYNLLIFRCEDCMPQTSKTPLATSATQSATTPAQAPSTLRGRTHAHSWRLFRDEAAGVPIVGAVLGFFTGVGKICLWAKENFQHYCLGTARRSIVLNRSSFARSFADTDGWQCVRMFFSKKLSSQETLTDAGTYSGVIGAKLAAAAKHGHADAQFEVGRLFLLTQDAEAAVIWLQRAADQGHEGAASLLPKALFETSQSMHIEKARKLCLDTIRSFDDGMPQTDQEYFYKGSAHYVYALILNAGDRPNPAEAIKHFRLALEAFQNCPPSEETEAEIYECRRDLNLVLLTTAREPNDTLAMARENEEWAKEPLPDEGVSAANHARRQQYYSEFAAEALRNLRQLPRP